MKKVLSLLVVTVFVFNLAGLGLANSSEEVEHLERKDLGIETMQMEELSKIKRFLDEYYNVLVDKHQITSESEVVEMLDKSLYLPD